MNEIILFLFALLFIILFFYVNYVRRERIEMRKEAVVGDMKYSARAEDYPGWLICDGRSLYRCQYKDLFDVIGTSYGSDSDDTFKLPDCRGRILGAIGQGVNLTNRTIGTSIGEERHTLMVSELVSHSHNGTTDLSGNHLHIGTTDVSGNHLHTGTSDVAGDHTHTGTTNSTGDHSHGSNANGGQGNLGLVTADGTNTVTDTDNSGGELNVWTTPRSLSISSAGSHSHTVSNTTGGSHTHGFTSSVNGSHTHPFTSNTTGQHTHTFTSNTTGGGQPFNVIQPTLFAGHVFIYYGLE
jgi:microcystin-dependent protein